ncbi:MAG: diguanylate cyclase domain-containing protein [Candidatus Dormibacteria bacterium]
MADLNQNARPVSTRMGGRFDPDFTPAAHLHEDGLQFAEDGAPDDEAMLAPQHCLEATATATRILGALQRPLNVEGEAVVASVSIGVALNGQEITTRQKLIKGADAAMYAAKQERGGRWQLFQAPRPRLVRR